MSMTTFVGFGERYFATYDVSLAIFLKYLIDAAEDRAQTAEGAWLAQVIPHWRVQAAITDLGFNIDEKWTSAQIGEFVEIVEQACAELAKRNEISAEEITGWQICENERLYTRGAALVSTQPILDLGRAIIALAKGTLAPPPQGFVQHFGREDGPGLDQLRSG